MERFFVRLFVKLAKPEREFKYSLRSTEQYRIFRRDFDKLTPRQRDALREYAKSNPNYAKLTAIVKERVGSLLEKRELGGKLSTFDKKTLDLYSNFFQYEQKRERIYIKDSSWLIWAEYDPRTKTCFIKMKNGSIIYPFFNVPKTKWLLIETGRGKYMWDWFGKHYSARPSNWIRGGRN